ncbi:MAG: hypothetical protein ACTSRP_03260 [Candidatus Helarchaeota archaeon]
MSKKKLRLILVLKEKEKLTKKRWEEIQNELGMSMADIIHYIIRENWKRECRGDKR